MNALPVAIAALAVAFASACALADGALLAPGRTGHAGPRWTGDVEHAHRALALARILSHLTAGVAIPALTGFRTDPSAGTMLVTIMLAVAAVAVVEGAARSLGHVLGPRATERLGPLVRVVEVVLAGPLALAQAADAALLRVMPPRGESDAVRERRAERFLNAVALEAAVSRGEEAIMHGVFALGDTEVREVMVPRVDIVGVEQDTSWSEMLARVRSSEHARLPVYADTLDDVIGILYAKDLIAASVTGAEPETGWRSLVRPATCIPTSKSIDAQLRDFQSSRTHIAIVIDEFGGTAGLVTIEDILEEIVGEIRDEYDVEEPAVEQEGDDKFWVAGRVTVDQLAELLGTNFGVEDVTTVGGLVYQVFGRVPRSGEEHVAAGFRLVVERVRRRRIERVYFERVTVEEMAR